MPTDPEKPRSEPEFLPPERKDQRGTSGQQDWTRQGSSSQAEGTYRMYVGRVSPLQMTIFAILGFLFVAAILFLFAGFLLIVIPAIAILVTISLVVAFFRKSMRSGS